MQYVFKLLVNGIPAFARLYICLENIINSTSDTFSFEKNPPKEAEESDFLLLPSFPTVALPLNSEISIGVILSLNKPEAASLADAACTCPLTSAPEMSLPL